MGSFILLLLSVSNFVYGAEESHIELKKIGYHKARQTGFKDGLTGRSTARLYSVAVITQGKLPTKDQIIQHVNKGHYFFKNGYLTKIKFFKGKENTPDVALVGYDYDTKYDKYEITDYSQYPTGKRELWLSEQYYGDGGGVYDLEPKNK
ncbi:hypothetical protein MYX76_17200 [Desulfobacterota bacterium AH_259_B03_O07]|nr:hypothetical protein [Desulfobacterota bacterium AH_259_B03_O07]